MGTSTGGSFTTLTDNAYKVGLATTYGGLATGSNTWTAPSGWTETVDTEDTSSNDMSGTAHYEAEVTAGAIGNILTTPSNYASGITYAWSVVALRESGESQGTNPITLPPVFVDTDDTTQGTALLRAVNPSSAAWAAPVTYGAEAWMVAMSLSTS